jgi:hypothetical protein
MQLVGAVDLTRNTLGGVWLHGVGFDEVIQAINGVNGMINHQKDASISFATNS